MLLDFLKPPPIEDDIPEEVETEEEGRYSRYEPEVYQFDNTDWEEEERKDAELLRKVSGFLWLVSKREFYRLKLTVDRQGREIVALKQRLNVSADKKFVAEATNIRQKQYELIHQKIIDDATIDSLNDEIVRKEAEIERLNALIEQNAEDFRREKDALLTTINSMASGKAVQKSVLQTETAEDNPMKAHQFVSATGRTAAENKAICYWLLKAGKTVEEVQKLSGIKSAQAYAKQGEAILKKQNVNLDIDGFIRTCPVTELNSNGYHPDYPGVEPTGYSFPQLVMDTLWK